MPEQPLCELPPDPPRYDPIATKGQDMLYFPGHIPDIAPQLKDELLEQYSQTSADRDEEVMEAMARRGVMRTFIGGVCTLVYCELAREVVPHL